MRIERPHFTGGSARACAAAALLLLWPAGAHGEVLIRWTQNQIPSPASLGITSIVVPAANSAGIRSALVQGYRLYLEVEGSALAGFVPPSEPVAGVVVKGKPSQQQLALLRQRLRKGARLITLDEQGKWPHIRTNWVTRNNDVLQVSSRSAQPWIENNAALLRIMRATHSTGLSGSLTVADSMPWITYPWQPVTLSEIDDGPQLENYLVAIAEAGSFGGDLLLPLHERFQKNLLLGLPQARAAWDRIRRHMEFYAWDLPGRYQPVGNIGVVTANPAGSFEVMNLLSRHNLPFQLIAPVQLSAQVLTVLDLVIMLDAPNATQLEMLGAFATKGGTVVVDSTPTAVSAAARGTAQPALSVKTKRPWDGLTPLLKSDDRVSYQVGNGRVVEVLKGIPDPNRFALEMRQVLGRDHRIIDIWNGITVITTGYKDPNGGSLLVTALNYAHQPLPVQLRVAGTFSSVQYESPDERAMLLPYQQRDGYTEFVLPALTIGARIFLSQSP